MPKTYEDKPMYPLPIECITIAEWCSNPDGVDPTQVHLIIGLEEADFSMYLRFKGTESLDKIIYALIEHRRVVWPNSDEIHETRSNDASENST